MGELFSHPVTVRYLEVDAQGVVFNSWYLAYFDDAMTAFLRARGLPYRTMVEAGYDVQLVRSEIDWRSGVRWQDAIEVVVATARIGAPASPWTSRYAGTAARSPARAAPSTS